MTDDQNKNHNTGGIAADHLRSLIERVERLTEEKKTITDDIREVFAEAKGSGFDIKAMRAVIKKRSLDSAERTEQEYMIDLYCHALGITDQPPLPFDDQE